MQEIPSFTELIEELRTISLFSGLDDETLDELATHAIHRKYQTGEMVVMEGHASPGLYYLQSGWLKVIKTSTAGREQILRVLEAGETFNEIGVFTDKPNPATAIALSPADVWWLPRPILIDLLRGRSDFAEHIIAKMADNLLQLVSLVTNISLRTVSGRLAKLILDDAEDNLLSRPRWYTQTELASRLGTVTDVVQRSLRDLEARGLIEVERDHILIRDPEGLRGIIK